MKGTLRSMVAKTTWKKSYTDKSGKEKE